MDGLELLGAAWHSLEPFLKGIVTKWWGRWEPFLKGIVTTGGRKKGYRSSPFCMKFDD